jgi:hypothetical protein
MYRSMIESLLYVTVSRPDVMFSVCICARFQASPRESHLKATKRILRYLKHTQCNITDQIIRAQVQKQAPKRSNF